MSEPTTPNIGLIVPNTGDLVGSWGTAALNPDFNVIDGMFGGILSLSLSVASTIALTTASATLTPGNGPYQSANSQVVLSGTLSGNNVIQLAQSGIYRFVNNCVTGGFYIQIAPATGTGNAVGLPPGEQWQVHFDGTNVRLYGLPHVGTMHDFCVATTPVWMTAFTVAPYLLCNGAVYTASVYPALANMLGSAWGGNGITTFGVPDQQNRMFIPLDFGGNNRITTAVCGMSGTQFGAVGGDQNLQGHTHTASVTDPGHTHPVTATSANPPGPVTGFYQTQGNNGGVQGGGTGANGPVTFAATNATTNVTVSNATTGVGAAGNVQPSIVGGMRFIKT